MDDFERRVLKRRRGTICDNVKVSEGLLDGLYERELIQQETVEQMIQFADYDGPITNQISRILDEILESQNPEAFEEFCEILEKNNISIAKELDADLRAEKGQLELDEEVVKEASMMVHRKFGNSKRLSETDKREIADLIAVKIQIAKEEWRHDLAQSRDTLEALRRQLAVKERHTVSLDRALRHFASEHDSQLRRHAHDMSSTSDVLRSTLNDTSVDPLDVLNSNLELLLDRAALIFKQRDMLTEERDKTLARLGIDVSGPGASADERSLPALVDTALADVPTAPLEKRCNELTAASRRATARVAELERQLDDMQLQLDATRRDREKSDVRNLYLRRRIEEMSRPAPPPRVHQSHGDVITVVGAASIAEADEAAEKAARKGGVAGLGAAGGRRGSKKKVVLLPRPTAGLTTKPGILPRPRTVK